MSSAAWRWALRSSHDRPFAGAGLQVQLTPLLGWTDRSKFPRAFHFQAPPLESFKRSFSYEWNDYAVISGPRSRPVQRGLMQVQFSTLFVGLLDHGHGYPWTVVDPAPINYSKDFRHHGPNAHAYVEMLRDILDSGTPFRFTAGNPNLWNKPDIDMVATLRELGVEERAGEVEARYVDMSFTEFRDPGLDVPSLGNYSKTRGRDVTIPIAALHYQRRNLYALAAYHYGDPTRYPEIMKANPFLKKVGPNVNLWATFHKSKTHRSITIPKVVVLG